jgi:hypothetical protein
MTMAIPIKNNNDNYYQDDKVINIIENFKRKFWNFSGWKKARRRFVAVCVAEEDTREVRKAGQPRESESGWK